MSSPRVLTARSLLVKFLFTHTAACFLICLALDPIGSPRQYYVQDSRLLPVIIPWPGCLHFHILLDAQVLLDFPGMLPTRQKYTFCILCLRMNNECAKRPDHALDMMPKVRTLVGEHHVDLVAGDFNSARWRRHVHVSTIERAFAGTAKGRTPAGSSNRLSRTRSGSSRGTERSSKRGSMRDEDRGCGRCCAWRVRRAEEAWRN